MSSFKPFGEDDFDLAGPPVLSDVDMYEAVTEQQAAEQEAAAIIQAINAGEGFPGEEQEEDDIFAAAAGGLDSMVGQRPVPEDLAGGEEGGEEEEDPDEEMMRYLDSETQRQKLSNQYQKKNQVKNRERRKTHLRGYNE